MTRRPGDLDVDALWKRAKLELQGEVGFPKHLVELHRRGTHEVFDRAVTSCLSPDVNERLLGVMVLRELGGAPPKFGAEAIGHLIAMLDNESSPVVRRWIISAIGYQQKPDADVLSAVLAHANDNDCLVRFAVAAALPGLTDPQEPEDSVVKALLRLATDAHSDTRYYALSALVDGFGLAAEKEVRNLLEDRLSDEDVQIQRCAQHAMEGGVWDE